MFYACNPKFLMVLPTVAPFRSSKQFCTACALSYKLGVRRPAAGVKSRPGSKSLKRVFGEVPEGSRPTPQKGKKRFSGVKKKQVIFDSQCLLETLFLGGRPGPLRDSPGPSFLTFGPGQLLTPVAGRRDPNCKHSLLAKLGFL